MQVRTLTWIQTSFRRLRVNGKAVTAETWISRTPFVEYKVYSSASGRCFVILPGTADGGLPGFFADSLTGSPKTACNSIEEGKQTAEKHWLAAVTTA